MPATKVLCRTQPDGRTSYCNAGELFRSLSTMLHAPDSQGRLVRVLVADARYVFEVPTETTIGDPSVVLHNLKDVEIIGVGSPSLIFSNTKAPALEIHGSERVLIKRLTLDYDFSADFRDALPVDLGFKVSPYGASFYDARVVAPGVAQVVTPLPALNLDHDIWSAFLFDFDPATTLVRTPGASKYYLPVLEDGDVSGYFAEMVVFGDRGDPTGAGQPQLSPTPGFRSRYSSPKLAEFPGRLDDLADEAASWLCRGREPDRRRLEPRRTRKYVTRATPTSPSRTSLCTAIPKWASSRPEGRGSASRIWRSSPLPAKIIRVAPTVCTS